MKFQPHDRFPIYQTKQPPNEIVFQQLVYQINLSFCLVNKFNAIQTNNFLSVNSIIKGTYQSAVLYILTFSSN